MIALPKNVQSDMLREILGELSVRCQESTEGKEVRPNRRLLNKEINRLKEAKTGLKTFGRIMDRNSRSKLAQETVKIIGSGFYLNAHGDKVDISSDIEHCLLNTELYKPDSFDLLREKLPYQNAKVESSIDVTDETTLSAAHRLYFLQKYNRIMCLNFASAKNPGGGFLGGSHAQEESLARSSGLYRSLIQNTEYYEFNRKNKTTLYSDHMIFSPKVPVFRDDKGQLLDKHYLVSFITAPAVNAGAVRRNEPSNVHKIVPTMAVRAEKVLLLAAYQNCDALVLGAWGCGVFQNNPKDVIDIWFDLIYRNNIFTNRFAKIVFAVPKSPKKTGSALSLFKERFNGAG